MKKIISFLLTFILVALSVSIPVTSYGAAASISTAYGWYEAIHIEWTNDSRVSMADVSYRPSGGDKYTEIDSQLIRKLGTGGQADIVGISQGVYDVKVITGSGQVLKKDGIAVGKYDRSGYAHFDYKEGVGGYKDDGTVKEGAQILYLTNENKNTIKLGNYTGIGNILTHASSYSYPIIIRVLGTIDTQTRDSNGKKTADKDKGIVAIDGLTDFMEEKRDSDGKLVEYDPYFNMLDAYGGNNITIEGIGTDAQITKWGFMFKKCNSIEVRNITFSKYPEDACSFQGSMKDENYAYNYKYRHFWVHNNYFKRGENLYDTTAEQDKHDGDGSSDFTGCRNITYSYNIFEKCHKTSLHGGGDSNLQYNSTWHHNYCYDSMWRMPVARQINLHTYNNYYYYAGDLEESKGTDARASGWVFTESNYYDHIIGILTTPNEKQGDPIVKSFNNLYTNNAKNADNAKTIVETTDRALKISPETGANPNQNPYPNFDTDEKVFYYDSANNCSNVEYMTDPITAKADIEKAAGIMKAEAVLPVYMPTQK